MRGRSGAVGGRTLSAEAMALGLSDRQSGGGQESGQRATMQLERWPGATRPRLHGPQHSTLCSRVIGDGSICLNISWKQSATVHMF